MSEALKVVKRNELGSRSSRRLRTTGQVPAVLYGHGQENVNLSLTEAELETAIRAGHKGVDLAGALQEKALIRQVQWDAIGLHVLHIDLTRVSATERVAVRVAVQLKGEAVGINNGGMMEQALFELEVEALASAIPDRLVVDISHLDLGDSLLAEAVELPAGVVLAGSPQTLVAQCVAKGIEADEDEMGVDIGGAEPEVIGRKPDEEDESSS